MKTSPSVGNCDRDLTPANDFGVHTASKRRSKVLGAQRRVDVDSCCLLLRRDFHSPVGALVRNRVVPPLHGPTPLSLAGPGVEDVHGVLLRLRSDERQPEVRVSDLPKLVGFRYSSGWVGALDRGGPERRWSVVSRFGWSSSAASVEALVDELDWSDVVAAVPEHPA